ncbi:hypothetical protein SLEP1_g9009 [Rubroshorea leprosula]|uniref:Uncharacterized protein n=1 Tax=Rubroshorea leprosula TaxID=152421 RepID=A0AAV5IEJ7_9ROSI|nr:hypothetical protein SLEP1_g9009 [Rubroshorea leprosula]
MGESSSHVPQIPSLSVETPRLPLEMNDPTLPTTTPFALNIPPSMGQVPTIQPTPSVEILRPALEDGKSKEVDHKLQQLEEESEKNFKFKQPDFDKYDGSRYPYAHLQMYARKIAPYANDERVQTGKLETIAMQYLSNAEKAKVYAELLIRFQVKTTAASELSDSLRDSSLL